MVDRLQSVYDIDNTTAYSMADTIQTFYDITALGEIAIGFYEQEASRVESDEYVPCTVYGVLTLQNDETNKMISVVTDCCFDNPLSPYDNIAIIGVMQETVEAYTKAIAQRRLGSTK